MPSEEIAAVILSHARTSDAVCDLAVGGGLRERYLQALAGKVARLTVVDPDAGSLKALGDYIPHPNRKPEALEGWLRKWSPPRGPIYDLIVITGLCDRVGSAYADVLRLATEAGARVLVVEENGAAVRALPILSSCGYETEMAEDCIVARWGRWAKEEGTNDGKASVAAADNEPHSA